MTFNAKPKRRAGCSVSALSREEWYSGLEESVALGLAKPGETYEEYLQGLYDDFDSVYVPPDMKPISDKIQ